MQAENPIQLRMDVVRNGRSITLEPETVDMVSNLAVVIPPQKLPYKGISPEERRELHSLEPGQRRDIDG